MSTTPKNPKPRRHYDDEFKKDSVNHVLRTGKSCAEVAAELGINSNLLARWRREQLLSADAKSTGTNDLKPSELAEQLRSARMENEDLREQRDILKKALSIFSQGSRSGAKR
ncbi:MAG: transposase [Gammaproteobacteria bacterium]|nr:transposase [Gammaproteobacteria bacterium]